MTDPTIGLGIDKPLANAVPEPTVKPVVVEPDDSAPVPVIAVFGQITVFAAVIRLPPADELAP